MQTFLFLSTAERCNLQNMCDYTMYSIHTLVCVVYTMSLIFTDLPIPKSQPFHQLLKTFFLFLKAQPPGRGWGGQAGWAKRTGSFFPTTSGTSLLSNFSITLLPFQKIFFLFPNYSWYIIRSPPVCLANHFFYSIISTWNRVTPVRPFMKYQSFVAFV